MLTATCSTYSVSTDGSLGPLGNPSASFAAYSALVSCAPVSASVSCVSAFYMGSSLATAGSASSTAGTAGESAGTAGESAGTAVTSSTTMTGTHRLHADAVGLRRWGAPSESSPSPFPRPLATILPNGLIL